MNRSQLLLSSALLLSLAAVVVTLTKPAPPTPTPARSVASRAGALSLQGQLSHGLVHASGTELFAELTVTLEDDGAPRTAQPIALALVLDRSGSMKGQKMEDARRAAHRLVDLLGEADQLAYISFSDTVRADALRTMNAENKALVHAAIDATQADGATFLSGGVEAGWQALRAAPGVRRLVVVSDGQPTAGLVDEPSLARLVGRAHDDGITVTTLGVGAEYDGLLMQHLAERGGGMYGYLRDGSVLDEVLSREVAAARSSRVRNVELALAARGVRILEVPGRHVASAGGRTVLHLADLQPNAPTKVLLHLQSLSADEPELAATLTWRPVDGEPLATALSLRARVTDDVDGVTASRDEALWSRGIAAVGGVRMLAAAAAYERGDVATAGSLLDNVRALYGMSADALAGQAEVDSMRRDFGRASSLQRKELSRSLEKKKLSDFGRANEGY